MNKQKLTDDIVNLYSFASNVFFENERFLRRPLTQRENDFLTSRGIKADMPITYINNTVKSYVDSFYSKFFVDKEIFEKYNKNQKEHLTNLNDAIEVSKQNTINSIVDKFFKTSIMEKPYIESAFKLGKDVSDIVSKAENTVENLRRQIGYCMVLWDYEKKGYDTYRLKSSDGCCENCANEDGKEFSIKDIENMEYFPLVHPNCRCKAEILNEDGKIVHTIDEKIAWTEIEKQKYNFDSLVQNLTETDLMFLANSEYLHEDFERALTALAILKNNNDKGIYEVIEILERAGFEGDEPALLELSYRLSQKGLMVSQLDAEDKIRQNEAVTNILALLGGKIATDILKGKNVLPIFSEDSALDMLEKNGYVTEPQKTQTGNYRYNPDELIVKDKEFLDKTGNIDWEKWAPNGGRVLGTIKTGQTLQKGVIIDRYGNQYGKYSSPVGTSYDKRALPYIENKNSYHKYEVIKPIRNITISQISGAFGEPGGGIQYELPLSIYELIKKGFLKEIK